MASLQRSRQLLHQRSSTVCEFWFISQRHSDFFFCSVFCFFSFPLFGIILTSLLGKGMRWIDEKDWYFVVESVRISINISDIGFIRGYCEM